MSDTSSPIQIDNQVVAAATPAVDATIIVKKAKAKAVSRSALAGTISPVGRLKAKMKKYHARVSCPRVSDLAAVSQAALMDYLASEVCTVAGENVQMAGRNRITPADISRTFREDEELNTLADNNTTIPRGGVLQYIDPMLQRRAKKNKRRATKSADTKKTGSATKKSSATKSGSKKSGSKKATKSVSKKSASKKAGSKKSASKKTSKSGSKKTKTSTKKN